MLYRIIIVFIIFPLLLLASCEPIDPVDNDDFLPPPQMGIMTINPDNTLGDLTVKLFIRKENMSVEVAPWPTYVYLFKTYHNYLEDIREFETYTYNNDSVYFGYLDPSYEYYVFAKVTTKHASYSALQSVTIYKNNHTVKSLIMDKEKVDP